MNSLSRDFSAIFRAVPDFGAALMRLAESRQKIRKNMQSFGHGLFDIIEKTSK